MIDPEIQRAAEHGDAEAQCQLGTMYEFGQGVTNDYAEAMKWYQKAAGQGFSVAQFCLGSMYEKGEGVPRNYAEAAKWYQQAAVRGYGVAQFRLGCMYEKGEGVPKDLSEAAEWYRKAADQGYIGAYRGLRKVMSEMERELNSRNEDAVDEDEEEIQRYRTKL